MTIMRLAILGNSHSACLLHALREDPAAGLGLSITFFAAIGQKMSDLSLKGGALRPDNDELRDSLRATSGGLEIIDPRAFDAFLLVGLGYNVPPVDRRLSAAVQSRILLNTIQESVSWKIAGLLRQLGDAPILIQHSPLRAGDIGPRHEDLLAHATPYTELIARANRIWAERGARVVPQPGETRFRDILTARSFSRGSRGLRGAGLAHENDDRSHMNADFGRLMLSQAAALLSHQTSPSR